MTKFLADVQGNTDVIKDNDYHTFNNYILNKKRKSYSPTSLRPTKGKSKRNHFDFAVADIEAGNWIDFCCIGFYHEFLNEYRYYESLLEFLIDVYQYAEQYNISNIFCHNGGKYDFSFLIKEACFSDRFEVIDIIDRGSSFLSFKVVDLTNFEDKLKGYKEKTNSKPFELCFWDSLALLPFSLKQICKSFEVETMKGEIDYVHIPEIFTNNDYTQKLLDKPKEYIVYHDKKLISSKPKDYKKSKITYSDITIPDEITEHKKIYTKSDLKSYLKDDCLALSQSLTKFYQLPPIKAVGPALTIASQSIKVWRSYLKTEVFSLSKKAREIALDGFYGGRTEMFRPIFSNSYDIKDNPIGFSKETLKQFDVFKGKTLKCFDINSLYPDCMRLEMPIRSLGLVKAGHKIDLSKMGIFKCKVFVPDELVIPPLPVRHTNEKTKQTSLIFPVGEFTGTWTTYELRYAVSIGCKILESYEGILLENGGYIFKDYVESMYEMRLKAKKDGNEPLQLTLKLLMNNTYGRLGMKRDRTTLEIDRGQPNVKEHSEIVCEKTGKSIRIVQKDVKLDNIFTNEAIPAWITSIARVKMHKEVIMKAGFENCFYMDTDSLYTFVDLPTSNEIGKLDFEGEESGMDEAVFILPKTYILSSIRGKKYKAKHRMKGFAARKIKHFNTEDFMRQFMGERVLTIKNDPKFATMKTALKKGMFLAMENCPETNRKADNNRLDRDKEELNRLEIRYQLLQRENANEDVLSKAEKHIIRTQSRVRSRENKLLKEYGVSYRSVKAVYDKRIISDDLMFTKPIKLPLEKVS